MVEPNTADQMLSLNLECLSHCDLVRLVERLTNERDQYKKIAEINKQTIEAMAQYARQRK